LSEGLDGVESIGLLEIRCLIVDNYVAIELLFVDFMKRIVSASLLIDDVGHPAAIVVALERPGIGVLSGFEEGNSSCTFFGSMIVDILAVHVLLGEVTALILEDLAVHRQDLGEETYLCLLLEFIR
jgi:hypothetical protein